MDTFFHFISRPLVLLILFLLVRHYRRCRRLDKVGTGPQTNAWRGSSLRVNPLLQDSDE